jgi:hypothetical protein
MKRNIIVAMSLVASLSMAGNGRAATVVTTGCADAAACQLSELIAGGTMLIDDLLFHNFANLTVNAVGGAAFDATQFTIVSHDTFGNLGPADEVGWAAREVNDAFQILGDQLLTFGFEYDVTTQGALITDNTLIITSDTISGNQGFIEVTEGASAATVAGALTQIADKFVFDDSRTGTRQESDHVDYAMGFNTVHIETEVVLNGGTGNLLIGAQFFGMAQTFSQAADAVPAPGSTLLFALGLAGFGFGLLRRRLRAS